LVFDFDVWSSIFNFPPFTLANSLEHLAEKNRSRLMCPDAGGITREVALHESLKIVLYGITDTMCMENNKILHLLLNNKNKKTSHWHLLLI